MARKKKKPHKIGSYQSKVPDELRTLFRVSMIVEFAKTMKVSAYDQKEALELVDARLRNRQKAMTAMGYSIGDIEILEVKVDD